MGGEERDTRIHPWGSPTCRLYTRSDKAGKEFKRSGQWDVLLLKIRKESSSRRVGLSIVSFKIVLSTQSSLTHFSFSEVSTSLLFLLPVLYTYIHTYTHTCMHTYTLAVCTCVSVSIFYFILNHELLKGRYSVICIYMSSAVSGKCKILRNICWIASYYL